MVELRICVKQISITGLEQVGESPRPNVLFLSREKAQLSVCAHTHRVRTHTLSIGRNNQVLGRWHTCLQWLDPW